ncbi:hypothetical protein PAUR_a3741 [Pseudoalteromonas aurantia 208]|uniref:Uncharacterized protein n=1 Tax=Pseudoalteromonas aurantia 208 TaxID=1314867 RepID=A0ABR9E6R8_9GAMM|nr:hypothetical protein [Pseudoalteromonas aurantia 208]
MTVNMPIKDEISHFYDDAIYFFLQKNIYLFQSVTVFI